MQQRYGYPDSLRSTDNEIWERLRKRFLRRMKVLQKHNLTITTPYRNNGTCVDCGKIWAVEKQYTHGRFCWTSTFRHRVCHHTEYVSPIFWLYVFMVTKQSLPVGKYERIVFKAYAGSEAKQQAEKLIAFYNSNRNGSGIV